ncbi:MAG: Ig-like domain-containing protein [Planctomycetia bacterium]|nr:Ig-like domain-containing protein [Planctomycetia bacterium]
MNMKTRSSHLESLEPRHLLSALPLTETNSGVSDVFVVQTPQSTSQSQYLVMHIESQKGANFSVDDVNVDGDGCDILKATSDGKVTSVLMKMGMGSSYTISLDNMPEDDNITVFVTVAGDTNFDGFASHNEYYTQYGQVLYDQGLNSRSVMLFQKMYGIDISKSNYDPLYDLNNNGKIDNEEFTQIFASKGYSNSKELNIDVFFRPQVKSGTLEVNGDAEADLTVVEENILLGEEVQGGMEITGTLSEYDTSAPVMAQISYDGSKTAVNLTELAETNGKFTLDVVDALSSESIEWSVGTAEELTVVLYGGKSDTKADDTSAFTLNFTIDLTSPNITEVKTQSVNGVLPTDGTFYSNKTNPSIEIQMTVEDKDTFLAYLQNTAKGVYVDLEYIQGNTSFTQTVQLTASMLTWGEEPNENTFTFTVTPSETLNNGAYTLNILPHNLAGNASTGEQNEVSLTVDTSVPVVAYSGTTLNALEPKSDKIPEGAIYTDDTLVDGASEKSVTVDVTCGIGYTLYYSLDGKTFAALDANTAVIPVGTLSYGENTLSYYVVNYAGTACETVALPIIVNEAPEVSTAGEALKTEGFVQAKNATLKTIDVAELFATDDGALASTPYEVEVNYDTGTPEFITEATITNGVLSFTYDSSCLTDDNPTRYAAVTLICTDEYGETAELTFRLKYTSDDEAPKATFEDSTWNTWNTRYEKATGIDFATTDANVTLTGKIDDVSEIVSFGIGIQYGNGTLTTIYETDGTNNATEFTYDEDTQEFELDLSSYLTAEGNYTLKVWGKDIYGNETDRSNAQSITIVYDSTAPLLEMTNVLTKTGTSTDTVNTSQPQFAPTFEGTLDTNDQENGVWAEIYVSGGTYTEPTLYAFGKYDSSDTSLTYTIVSLADGTYTFTCKVVDAAGNENDGNSLTVTVDTTKPTKLSYDNSITTKDCPDTSVTEDYTNDDAITFSNFRSTDASDVTYYVSNGTVTKSPDTNDEVNFDLTWGENTFTIWCVDSAGNESEKETYTVVSNNAPTVVTEPGDKTLSSTSTQISLSKTEVEGAFKDLDTTSSGDELTYYYTFAAADGSGVENITEMAELTLDGENYVVTLTVTDSDKLNVSEKFGTLTLIAKDTYGESVDTSLTVWKENLAPRIKDMNLSFTYKGTGTINLSDYLYDETSFANLTINSIQFKDTDGTTLHTFTLKGDDAEYDAETGVLTLDAVLQEYFGEGTLVISVTDKAYLADASDITATLSGKVTLSWDNSFRYTDGTTTATTTPTVATVLEDADDGTVYLANFTKDQWSSTAYIGGLTEPTITYELVGSVNQEVFDKFEIDEETGEISYSLVKDANGTVGFQVRQVVNGEATNSLSFQFVVNAVEDDPVGNVITGNFTLKDTNESKTFDIIDLGGCTDPDGGTLSVTSITVDGTVIKAGKSATLDGRFTFALENGVLTVTQLDDNKESVEYTFSYTLSKVGDETRTTTVSGNTIKFTSYATDITLAEATRQYEDVSGSVAILNELGLSSSEWKVTDVEVASQDATMAFDSQEVNTTGTGIDYVLNEGSYGSARLTYTIQNNNNSGETYTADIIFTVTVNNSAPTWASTTPLTNNTYVWSTTDAGDEGGYVLNNVSTLFTDYDTKDLKNGIGVPTSEYGTFVYNSTADTLTFTPNTTGYTTEGLDFIIRVTDQAVDTAAAETTEFSFQLVITHKIETPTITAAPSVSGTAGEEISVSMMEFLNQVTLKNGESDTKLQYLDSNGEWQDGTYTFTPDTMGIYTFQIRAVNTDNGSTLVSEAYTVNVCVGGTLEVTDESLNVGGTLEVEAGTATSGDITLAEDAVIPAGTTIATNSVLKAGTTLGAGTSLSRNCEISGSEDADLSWLTSAEVYYDGTWIFDEDYIVPEGGITLKADITVKRNSVTTVTGTTLAAGSVLKAGTVFSENTTLKQVDITDAENIYKNYAVDGTLPTCEFNLTDALNGKTIDEVVADFEDNSCFQSVAVSADGKSIIVSYLPYNPDQVRTPQEITLKTTDGLELSVNLAAEYETPFEVEVRVVSSESATTDGYKSKSPNESVSSTVEGTTYYLEIWLKCTLPLYQDVLINNYTTTSILSTYSLNIPADYASGISITSTSSNMYKITENTDDGSITLEFGGITGTGEMVSVSSSLYACGYNDDFLRIGLYKFTTTTGFQADFAEAQEQSLALEFGTAEKTDGTSTTYGVSGAANASQKKLTSIDIPQATPLKGTQAARETVVEGSGVYLSLVKEKTESETVSELPESAEYLTEWDTSYVELWVNTQDPNVDIENVQVDLLYNTEYFTATGIEYGEAVANGLASAITDAEGKITQIGGDLSHAVTNADGFVLLARVKLESTGDDNVAGDNVGAVKSGLVLENILLTDHVGNYIDPNTQVYVNTKIYPVVYDSNDDGIIDVSDLITFAKRFGKSSADSTDVATWAMDFDKSGVIDVSDLIAFAKNFGKGRDSSSSILYPERFMEQWIGSTILTTGDTSLADMLDTTIGQWEEKLGEELDLQVQIIVKDLENDDLVLGQTLLVGVDENGKPNTAVVYLDSDALGMGWYVGEEGLVPNEQYDLYTVLLHELGHVLGMNSAYTGYTDVVDVVTGTYTDANGDKTLVLDGHVVDDSDLMYPELNPGERKEISDIDAEIISAVREQGGTVTTQTWMAVDGTVADGMLSVETASSIVAEDEWNASLVQAAKLEVRKVEELAADEVLAQMETEMPVAQNPSTATVDGSEEDLFADDEFENLLDEISLENLNVTLDK